MMAHHLPVKDIKFISDFATYARSRGDVKYNYFDSRNCALAQFLKYSRRALNPLVGGNTWDDEKGTHRIPSCVDCAIASMPPTFSGLADRLENLLIDAPRVSA